jgi:multidrug efflux pump subunit AcrB
MLVRARRKNAILIVEFAKAKRGGLSVRMRRSSRRASDSGPILMTAFAFILGVVP